MKRIITVGLLLLLALPAHATKVIPVGTLLDAVALNAGAASLTFYVGQKHDCGVNNSCAPTSSTDTSKGESVIEASALRLEVAFDYTAQAGTITLTCTEGATRATATATPASATLSSGTYTLAWGGVVVTPSLSADKTWPVVINLNATPVVKCVASHGGTPGATDKITVKGWLLFE